MVTELCTSFSDMVDVVAIELRVAAVSMSCSPYVRKKPVGRAVPFGMQPSLVTDCYVLGVWHVSVLGHKLLCHLCRHIVPERVDSIGCKSRC